MILFGAIRAPKVCSNIALVQKTAVRLELLTGSSIVRGRLQVMDGQRTTQGSEKVDTYPSMYKLVDDSSLSCSILALNESGFE